MFPQSLFLLLSRVSSTKDPVKFTSGYVSSGDHGCTRLGTVNHVHKIYVNPINSSIHHSKQVRVVSDSSTEYPSPRTFSYPRHWVTLAKNMYSSSVTIFLLPIAIHIQTKYSMLYAAHSSPMLSIVIIQSVNISTATFRRTQPIPSSRKVWYRGLSERRAYLSLLVVKLE